MEYGALSNHILRTSIHQLIISDTIAVANESIQPLTVAPWKVACNLLIAARCCTHLLFSPCLAFFVIFNVRLITLC